jgi:hypothetical protein
MEWRRESVWSLCAVLCCCLLDIACIFFCHLSLSLWPNVRVKFHSDMCAVRCLHICAHTNTATLPSYAMQDLARKFAQVGQGSLLRTLQERAAAAAHGASTRSVKGSYRGAAGEEGRKDAAGNGGGRKDRLEHAPRTECVTTAERTASGCSHDAVTGQSLSHRAATTDLMKRHSGRSGSASGAGTGTKGVYRSTSDGHRADQRVCAQDRGNQARGNVDMVWNREHEVAEVRAVPAQRPEDVGGTRTVLSLRGEGAGGMLAGV